MERMTRRRFLGKAAAVGAGLAILGLGVQCGATPTPEVVDKVVKATVVKETPAWEAPERILFIGSGPTFWNFGVDKHLRELAASRDPPLTIETGAAGGAWGAAEGARLQHHYENFTFALDKIREGGWDVVVLQENQETVTQVEELFYEYARKLDEEIKKAGARTVFYMMWGLERAGRAEAGPLSITTESQARPCGKIAAELGARVAPVGLAWERSREENPDLELTGRAQSDPSMGGTYLAACVFYATLLGESPVGLSYAPEEISEEERTFLQRMAWETVQEYEQPAAD